MEYEIIVNGSRVYSNKPLENLLNVIIYDETSPYLHIVGVPIKVGGKNGLSKQVGKSDVLRKNHFVNYKTK